MIRRKSIERWQTTLNCTARSQGTRGRIIVMCRDRDIFPMPKQVIEKSTESSVHSIILTLFN
jgi:hypothetical protein